jgi:hypothetical protein
VFYAPTEITLEEYDMILACPAAWPPTCWSFVESAGVIVGETEEVAKIVGSNRKLPLQSPNAQLVITLGHARAVSLISSQQGGLQSKTHGPIAELLRWLNWHRPQLEALFSFS